MSPPIFNSETQHRTVVEIRFQVNNPSTGAAEKCKSYCYILIQKYKIGYYISISLKATVHYSSDFSVLNIRLADAGLFSDGICIKTGVNSHLMNYE